MLAIMSSAVEANLADPQVLDAIHEARARTR